MPAPPSLRGTGATRSSSTSLAERQPARGDGQARRDGATRTFTWSRRTNRPAAMRCPASALYKGTTSGEVYTKLGQLDTPPSSRSCGHRSRRRVHLSARGMGINFSSSTTRPGFRARSRCRAGLSADEDVIRAVGNGMRGMFNSSTGNRRTSTTPRTGASSRTFEKDTAGCRRCTRRRATTRHADDSAVRRRARAGSRTRTRCARALRKADFKSVRGAFRFNNNHYPVQDYSCG